MSKKNLNFSKFDRFSSNVIKFTAAIKTGKDSWTNFRTAVESAAILKLHRKTNQSVRITSNFYLFRTEEDDARVREVGMKEENAEDPPAQSRMIGCGDPKWNRLKKFKS